MTYGSCDNAPAYRRRPSGQLLGVSRQTVNAIETGKYDPSLPLAIRIARHFDTGVEEVFHVD